MQSPDLANAHWRKSSRSGNNNACVEVAVVPSATGIRDSKNPTGPTLLLGSCEFWAFLGAVKAGRLDV